MRRRFTLVVFLSLALAAGAQQKFTFHTSTRLVLEPVQVETRRGEPVPGLKAGDFTVTENGVRQNIAFCRYQRLADVPTPGVAAMAPQAPAAGAAVGVAPEEGGSAAYNNRRLLVLYFDMTAMPPGDQFRALAAAQKFIAGQMRAADMVEIMEYAGNGVRVKQGFTADRDRLQRAITSLIPGARFGLGGRLSDAASASSGAAFGQDDSEFNIFDTNRQLAALHTAIDMLAPLREKKALVYFASGLNLHGVDNQAQLEATTNAAIKANVALFPLDARGLVASAPLGDASQGSPGGLSMYNGAAADAMTTRLISSQDTLYALGSDTGGKAILDTNNLGAGIATARNAIGSYYLIGYYSGDSRQDGRFRRIVIALHPPLAGVRLSYRRGYYAQKAFSKFNAADRERQLEDALMLANPITQITMDLQLNYFQLDSANYFVPVAVSIPGSELDLSKKHGTGEATVDFIGEVKDNYGTTMANVRDRVHLKLSPSTVGKLVHASIEYTTGFTLLPGDYTVKLLARDDQSGRIGTYIKSFHIPNLMHARGLPISTVVLSSQRVAIGAALFNTEKSAAARLADPLVQDGQQLLPNVTRTFSRRQTLYVYLQAYEHGAAGAATQPLEAYVTFFRGGARAYETPVLAFNEGREGPAGAVPIAISLRLASLPAGAYTCQVSVLNPEAQAAAFWRTSVSIIP